MTLRQGFTHSLKIKGVTFLFVTTIAFMLLLASGQAPSICVGLKPYNSLNELLYQLYINLNSECLFKMPVAELEKKWDTKILSDERIHPGQAYFQVADSADFGGKSYRSARDAFYVERKIDTRTGGIKFNIIITEDYRKISCTLFQNNKSPKNLPFPDSRWFIRETFSTPLRDQLPTFTTLEEVSDIKANIEQEDSSTNQQAVVGSHIVSPLSLSVYPELYSDHTYFWRSYNKSRIIYFDSWEDCISSITITNKLFPMFRDFIDGKKQ